MGYTKRIDTLCGLLSKTDVFADVGCDHGYCTEYMLGHGFCERAIFSDVSKGSLAKAERLLAPYVRAGKAVSVLGFPERLQVLGVKLLPTRFVLRTWCKQQKKPFGY